MQRPGKLPRGPILSHAATLTPASPSIFPIGPFNRRLCKSEAKSSTLRIRKQAPAFQLSWFSKWQSSSRSQRRHVSISPGRWPAHDGLLHGHAAVSTRYVPRQTRITPHTLGSLNSFLFCKRFLHAQAVQVDSHSAARVRITPQAQQVSRRSSQACQGNPVGRRRVKGRAANSTSATSQHSAQASRAAKDNKAVLQVSVVSTTRCRAMRLRQAPRA
jgi:hypothetical protein